MSLVLYIFIKVFKSSGISLPLLSSELSSERMQILLIDQEQLLLQNVLSVQFFSSFYFPFKDLRDLAVKSSTLFLFNCHDGLISIVFDNFFLVSIDFYICSLDTIGYENFHLIVMQWKYHYLCYLLLSYSYLYFKCVVHSVPPMGKLI